MLIAAVLSVGPSPYAQHQQAELLQKSLLFLLLLFLDRRCKPLKYFSDSAANVSNSVISLNAAETQTHVFEVMLLA